MWDELQVRSSVKSLACFIVALPAALWLALGLAGAGFAVPRIVVLGLLASWIGVRLLSTNLSGRFSEVERRVLRFWGFSAFFTLSAAVAIGAVPVIAVLVAARRLGWSEHARVLCGVTLSLGVIACAAALVWAAWRRFAASLARE